MTTNNAWNSQNPAQESKGGTNQSTYTQGDILYASAGDTLSKLPIGGASAQLTNDGTDVSWGPSGDGALIFLNSYGVSNTQYVNVTGQISSTYRDYWVVVTQMHPDNTSNTGRLRVSTDNGSSYESGSTDYGYICERNRFSDGDNAINNDASSSKIELTINGEVRSSTGTGMNLWIRISDPYSTTTKTRFRWRGNYLHQGTSSSLDLRGSGMYNTAARTDAFRLYFESGDQDSFVSIYGLTDS